MRRSERAEMEVDRKEGYHHPLPQAERERFRGFALRSLHRPCDWEPKRISSGLFTLLKVPKAAGRERESMSVRLSLSHLLAFLLTAFEEAMGSERCLH